MTAFEREEVIKRKANLICKSVVISDGEEEVRAAGAKLDDPNLILLLSMTNSSLRICCDDSIFAGLLLTEICDSLLSLANPKYAVSQ